MTDYHDPFAGLDTDLNAEQAAPTGITRADLQVANGGESLRTCPKCGGRGRLTYGANSYSCRMCSGAGRCAPRRVKAVEAAAKARDTVERNRREGREAFQAAHKAEIAYLESAADWSDFFRSLLEQVRERGSLSDRQLDSVRSAMAKAEARKAAKAAERQAAAKPVDVSAIEALFDKARASGLKKLVFRARDDLAISPAPETGRNAGALYVKEAGTYVGKIQNGRFESRGASAKATARLLAVAADPTTEAKLYGKETGNCCCCGRELTDPVSVAAGIGPICAAKWSL